MRRIHFLAGLVAASIAGAFAAHAAGYDTSRYDLPGPSVVLPGGREVNAAATYWTDIVGVPFDRDAVVAVPPTPLDLDLDGRADVTFQGTWSLKGGILANPDLIGLIQTPDDPDGTVGRYSISTGFLGVREEMDPATRRGTGRYAFNCWHCHAGADANGDLVLGHPNTSIHLGLILAASRVMDPQHVIRPSPAAPPVTPEELCTREGLDASFVLDPNDDRQVTIAEWRQALRMPSTDTARAQMLLAGPGRLDQSVDFRMDGLIPLANLQQYMRSRAGPEEHLRAARRSKRTVFNPVSLPASLSGLGVAHYSWSGKDSSMRFDSVALLTRGLHVTADQLAGLLRFPFAGEHVDYEALSRALTLDLRNVGTFGSESDDLRAISWSHAMLASPTAAMLVDVPRHFNAVELRELLLTPRIAGAANRSPSAGPPIAETAADAVVERGRAIFTERVTGEILNQRVVLGREAHWPPEYAGIPVLAPLDRSKPITAKVAVRCATCHNHSPTALPKPVAAPLPPLQRCDVCHLDHPALGEEHTFVELSEFMRRTSIADVADCMKCHKEHPDFGSQSFSNSWLLPFDANANGQTHGNEEHDAAAGGIGTDARLNLDSLFVTQLRPKHARPEKQYLIADDARRVPETLGFSSQGAGWVRVAPLILTASTAPYLHNGSVPTLEALLSSHEARPVRFMAGRAEQHFEFDTQLPGNGNSGHDFGRDLSREDRSALVAYLKSIR